MMKAKIIWFRLEKKPVNFRADFFKLKFSSCLYDCANTRLIYSTFSTNQCKNQTTRSIIWQILAISNLIIPHKEKHIWSKTKSLSVFNFNKDRKFCKSSKMFQ